MIAMAGPPESREPLTEEVRQLTNSSRSEPSKATYMVAINLMIWMYNHATRSASLVFEVADALVRAASPAADSGVYVPVSDLKAEYLRQLHASLGAGVAELEALLDAASAPQP